MIPKGISKHSTQVAGQAPLTAKPRIPPKLNHRTKSTPPAATSLPGNPIGSTAPAGTVSPEASGAHKGATYTGAATVGYADPVATPDVPDFSDEGMARMADKLFRALRRAHGTWRLEAQFRDIQITGPVALGNVGCLRGPDLGFLMRPHLVGSGLGNSEELLIQRMGEIIGESFELWQNYVVVPSLPWYPSFAFFPGAVAPPMPNVPSPLSLCISSMAHKITSPSDMAMAFTQGMPLTEWENEAFFENVANAVCLSFSVWLSTAMVSNLMGYGTVPNYNPPYVGGGPVIDGRVMHSPGCLSSGATVSPIWIG